MKLKKIVASFPIVALSVVLSYSVLDERIALFVKKLWMSSEHLFLFSLDIPDVLFFLVCLITGAAWIIFFYLTRKGIYNTQTRFFQLIAVSIPLANMVKSLLKYSFGRIVRDSGCCIPMLMSFTGCTAREIIPDSLPATWRS